MATYADEWAIAEVDSNNTSKWNGLATVDGVVKKFTSYDDADTWAAKIYGTQEYIVIRKQTADDVSSP